jgi:hypothetical protein
MDTRVTYNLYMTKHNRYPWPLWMNGDWHFVDPRDWNRTYENLYTSLYQKTYSGRFMLWSFTAERQGDVIRFRYTPPAQQADRPLTYWFTQQQIEAAEQLSQPVPASTVDGDATPLDRSRVQPAD